jgi:phosphopantetheinyl transferase
MEIYIIEINKFQYDSTVIKDLPLNIQEHIKSKKNENSYKESLVAWSTLNNIFRQKNVYLNVFFTDNGKPLFLDNSWYFNITHSHNIIALGISKNALGIDVEKVDNNKNIDFSLIEKRFGILPSHQDNSQDSFFQSWTRFESYVKYLGKSIFLKLDGIIESKAFTKSFKDSFNDKYYLAVYSDDNNIIDLIFK